MDQHAFEAAVLRMWTATRILLTRANIQAFSSVIKTLPARSVETRRLPRSGDRR